MDSGKSSSRELFEQLCAQMEAEQRAIAEERAKLAEERAQLEALRKNVRELATLAPDEALVLKLCVGGQPFELQARTLRAYPSSLLAGLCAQVVASPDPAAAMPLFIDRDARLFPIVCCCCCFFLSSCWLLLLLHRADCCDCAQRSWSSIGGGRRTWTT